MALTGRPQILRGPQHQVTLRQDVDAADSELMRDLLVSWLEANGWDQKLWGQFTINVGNRVVKA